MTCPICLEDIEKEEQVLNCGHKFHYKCFDTWIKNSLSCPYCRKNLKIITNLIETPIDSLNYQFKKKTKCKTVVLDSEPIYDSYQQLINQSPVGFLQYNETIEPVYKINNKYISYYFRQIILWNNIDYQKIYNYNTDCNHKIYHTTQDICKGLNNYNFNLMYDWIYNMMLEVSEKYCFTYTVDMNSILLDLCVNNIKRKYILTDKFQTIIIVSIYIILNEHKIYNHSTSNLTIDKLIEYTDNSSSKEDFMKFLDFQSNFIKKNIKIL